MIAKFTRAADDVYELDVEGEARPLGVTGEHPFFVRTYRARDSLISTDDDGEWKETRNGFYIFLWNNNEFAGGSDEAFDYWVDG